MADSYQNVRDADLLGPFIGQRIVEITQHDADEFAETREAYVILHFESGDSLQFPITDAGFHILGAEDDGR